MLPPLLDILCFVTNNRNFVSVRLIMLSHFVDLDGVLSHLHADDEVQAKPPSMHGKEASVHHTPAIP